MKILVKDADLDLNEIANLKIDELSKAYGWARYKDLSETHFRTEDDTKPLLIMAQTVYLWILNKFPKT
ncbi:MAG: hypothetical protein WCO06_03355 [Candidatus Roizmanbacteria bacterium]